MCLTDVSPSGHRQYANTWAWVRLDRNCVVVMVVGEFQPEFSVNFQLVAGLGYPQNRQEPTQCIHQLTDFVTAHSLSRERATGRSTHGGDHRRVRTGIQSGAMSGEFAVAFGDRST